MSEEKESKKRIITELKHPLPDKRISFDSQLDIVSAYVVASNKGKNEVGYKELAPYIKIDPVLVSGCNKFFQHLGLIEPGQKFSKYNSTPLAEELHNAKQWDNEELKKSVLSKILQNAWFWNQTRQYLEVNKTATKDQLTQKLGIGCGADPQKHTPSLNKLIEYLQIADLIKENNGKFELNTKLSSDKEYQVIEQEQKENLPQKIKVDSNVSKTNITNSNNNSISISLGLMINPETTEEQIRKAVRTVVDELDKIQKEKEENSK